MFDTDLCSGVFWCILVPICSDYVLGCAGMCWVGDFGEKNFHHGRPQPLLQFSLPGLCRGQGECRHRLLQWLMG